MIRALRATAMAVALLVVIAPRSHAQRGGRNPNRQPPPGGQMPPGQRIAQIVKERLQLTDQQVTHMQEWNQHFAERRQSLGTEEGQTRGAMRTMICSGDTTRGADMTKLLDQWHDINRRRLQLQEDEQRELAAFLTPYQRAKYLGFEDQMGRLMDGIGGRGGRAGMMGPPPDGGPGGPGGRGALRPGRAMRQGGGPPPDGAPPPRGRPGQLPDGCGNDGTPPPVSR